MRINDANSFRILYLKIPHLDGSVCGVVPCRHSTDHIDRPPGAVSWLIYMCGQQSMHSMGSDSSRLRRIRLQTNFERGTYDIYVNSFRAVIVIIKQSNRWADGNAFGRGVPIQI